MKIVVLGSNSFWGQDFIDLVLRETDAQVVGISRSPEKHPVFLSYREYPKLVSRFQFHRIDIASDTSSLLDLLDDKRPDWIVNFAAQSQVVESWLHPEQWIETNVSALARIVNHLRHQEYVRRWLQISTPEVYGSTGEYPMKEADSWICPSTPYAVSKAAADMLLRTCWAEFDFPAITVRAANIYGLRQQLYKIIPKGFVQLRRGEKIMLHGGGRACRSFLYVREASSGVLSALSRGSFGSVYHLSGDSLISIRQLVHMICARRGKNLEDVTVDVEARPGADLVYDLDDSKARNELAWERKIPLEHGLAMTSSWIDENWNVLKDLPLEYQHKS